MSSFWVIMLLIVEFVLLGISYLKFKGDFVSPTVVTLVLFIISTASCLYGLADWKNVVFTWKAFLLFAISFLLMFYVEAFVKNHRFMFGKQNKIVAINNTTFNRKLQIVKPFDLFLFIFFMFCALYYMYRVYQSGVSLGGIGLSAIGLNKEEGDYDGFSRLLYNLTRLASYVYAVIVSHNIFCCKDRMRNNLQGIVIIGITMIITFFSGQRSSSICYIIGLVVAATISMHDSTKIIEKIDTKKFIRKLVIIAIGVIALFYLSSNIVKGTSVEREFVDYMTYYFGSTTGLMGVIVENPDACHTHFVGYFGEKTFMGFWNTMFSLGLVPSEPCDRRWINMGSHIAIRAGNEYTFLCGPYIDFGFIGALIFVVLFYCGFSWIYYKKILAKNMSIKRVYTTAIYVFLYAMVAMSFYQDTIRSYSRPINIAYILYIIAFCKFFVRFKKTG